MGTILIIDDESTNAKYLSFILKRNGYQTRVSYTGEKGLKIFEEDEIDIVFTDFQLTDTKGNEVLSKIKKINPDVPVIIFTGYADVKTAVDVMKLGAFDYLIKPLVPEEVIMVVKKAVDKYNISSKNHSKKDTPHKKHTSDRVHAVVISDESDYKKKFIVGESSKSQTVQKQVELVAKTNFSVIIYGESGTGKESIAHSIHQHSKRNEGPFIAVDCGALVKELSGSELFGHEKGAFTGALTRKLGCFELAHKGFLFLDEIGDMPHSAQVKLLRAVELNSFRRVGGREEIEVDVSLISATNKILIDQVKSGSFREDLFYRLNVIELNIPPLRHRKEDIPLLISYHIDFFSQKYKLEPIEFSEECVGLFMSYDWPGNVRELRNIVERSFVLIGGGGVVDPGMLPTCINKRENVFPKLPSTGASHLSKIIQIQVGMSLEEIERTVIDQTLDSVDDNKTEAAKILGFSRKTLHNKLDKYNKEKEISH